MKKIIFTALLFSLVALGAMLVVRTIFGTESFLSDIGGINNFIGIFGTLYGIMAAFVVFEVWNQYNKTVDLIDAEASGLVDLLRQSSFFRDQDFLLKMKDCLTTYVALITENNFRSLSDGKKSVDEEEKFSEISRVIQEVKFNDDHDAVVFDHIFSAYEKLWQVRQQRMSQSSMRLPPLLKTFFYLASGFILFVFVVMPFERVGYAILTLGMLSFILSFVSRLIEDLDNPFTGYWNIDAGAFHEALEKIRKM